ncbi:MAG: ABC-2 transporter permease [Gammaproteobacteria bacterium]|nr:ABC-2 transporter permease [Gammaproteobacteria bacterium]MDH5303181.1 ABC-2 transporter permease [Gammaproteobacteria bacterium]
MMMNQLALMRREVWEHRSIWVTPSAVAMVVTLLTLAMFVAASKFGDITDMAIIGASSVGDHERRMALLATLLGYTSVFLIAMWILTIFYCLDTLYSERKDKSILFWRSLPITDAETVISKLLTAMLLIPLVTFAAVAASHLVNLVLISLWINSEGGSPGTLIWGSVPLFDTWLALLVVLLAVPLWISPLLGWFLFVSAWTKRNPFLTAFLPLAVLPILEYVILRSHLLWDAITARLSMQSMPLFSINPDLIFDDKSFRNLRLEDLSLLKLLDISKLLSSLELWIGLIVCGLFATAAIYIRRYRDDS